MAMSPRIRKLVLTAHVTSSVGWLGAVASFLALAVAGVTGHDVQMVRAAALAMDVLYRFVIVPLCFASVLTGLVSSLGTKWGLFRHYWVMMKLLLTIPATILLLVHTQPVSYLASAAADTTLSSADVGRLRIELVYYAGAALHPLVSFVISGVIVAGTWGLLRDSVRLSLDAVPAGIDMDEVRAYLTGLTGVTEIYDLHVWAMSTTETALTVHMVMPLGHPGDAFVAEVCEHLRGTFHISHATTQIETDPNHPCVLAPDHVV